MKNILLKNALPFLLGVVVTILVQALIGPCCKEAKLQQEMANMSKLVEGINKTVNKQTKSLNRLVEELPEEKAKAAEKAKAKAVEKTNAKVEAKK